MKIRLFAGCALASLALAGCNTLSPLAVNTKAAPEAQKVQADAKAAFDQHLAERLDHCEIKGTLGAGAGGLAPTVGFTSSLLVDCTPKPWESVTANPFTSTPSAAPPGDASAVPKP